MFVFRQMVVCLLLALPAVAQSQAFATITIKPAGSVEPGSGRQQMKKQVPPGTTPDGTCWGSESDSQVRLLHAIRQSPPVPEPLGWTFRHRRYKCMINTNEARDDRQDR